MQEARYLPWGNVIQCVYKRQRTPGEVPWKGPGLDTGKPLPEGTPGEPSGIPNGHCRKISPGCDLKTDQRGGRNQKDTPKQANEYQKRMELLTDTSMRSPEKMKHGGIPRKSTGEEVQQPKRRKKKQKREEDQKKTNCVAGSWKQTPQILEMPEIDAKR